MQTFNEKSPLNGKISNKVVTINHKNIYKAILCAFATCFAIGVYHQSTTTTTVRNSSTTASAGSIGILKERTVNYQFKHENHHQQQQKPQQFLFPISPIKSPIHTFRSNSILSLSPSISSSISSSISPSITEYFKEEERKEKQKLKNLEKQEKEKLLESKTITTTLKNEEEFCDSVEQKAGYIRTPQKGNHYFYWFFESRDSPSTDPLILWLTGGPGCSSLQALLTENGPCRPIGNSNTLKNPYSWNSNANVIWLDQPVGVGFSYGSIANYDLNSADVGLAVHHFLQEWFKENPKFQNHRLFIFGESYAGHYIPMVATQILHKNSVRQKGQTFIHLDGIGIGNGLTNPQIQFQYAGHMINNSYNIPLIKNEEKKLLDQSIQACVDLINLCTQDDSYCGSAVVSCKYNVLRPMYEKDRRNPYDIRKTCQMQWGISECYDHGYLKEFLNSPLVRQKLNVSNDVKEWQECNMIINHDFATDWMKNYAQYIPDLLHAGLQVLIYAGDADLMCNWIGNFQWTKQLEWDGRKDYNLAKDNEFSVNGIKAGTLRSSQGLHFARVYHAGHMVSFDQPQVALELVNSFLHQTLLNITKP